MGAIPTTKVYQAGGRYMICNTADVDAWIAKGWTAEPPAPPAPPAEDSAAPARRGRPPKNPEPQAYRTKTQTMKRPGSQTAPTPGPFAL